MAYIIWTGVAITLISVAMLGWCVYLAVKIRRAGMDEAEARVALRRVLNWNMAAIAFATIGLMTVVLGVMLS